MNSNKQIINASNLQPPPFSKQFLNSQSCEASDPIGTDGMFKCLDTESVTQPNLTTHKQEVNDADYGNVKKDETNKTRLFRYLISVMGLLSITLAIMSRVILNVAIVEIGVRQPEAEIELASEHLNGDMVEDVVTTPRLDYLNEDLSTNTNLALDLNASTTNLDIDLNWSMSDKNFVLSSFYLGYSTTMFFGGVMADTYGSKILILLSVLGGTLINVATPYLATNSYALLITSRIFLGVIHGSLVPALFDLFNRWLTVAEKSIFAPMLKMSVALGGVASGFICVVVLRLGFAWPITFYLTGVLGFVFSTAWLILASNEPQGNPFLVEPTKKNQIELLTTVDTKGKQSIQKEETKTKDKAPILLIITNRSVIVLGITKLSMGFGLDFLFSMLSIYLRDAHSASTEKIGFVVTQGPIIQMILTIPVAWLAKYAVENESFGFNRTVWRKIFQGFTNFSMALCYLLMTLFHNNLNIIIILLVSINLASMFCVGGESMIPYDLSRKYPATIMGIAHSFSLIAGYLVPLLATLVVDESNGKKPEQWNILFLILAGFLFIGGLLFVTVLKAEPFLPGEKEEFEKQSV